MAPPEYLPGHLPERVRRLSVRLNGRPCGELAHDSQIAFTYATDDTAQPAVGLLMPPTKVLYQSNTMFPVMDQNLPEGYLFHRIRELFPKQRLTVMHLLALIGENAIGRLGFHLLTPAQLAADAGSKVMSVRRSATPISRETLLRTRFGPGVFDDLVAAYLSTGLGIAGVQPKVMVPDRAAIPTPNLIVKAGSPAYPGLAANEYLCLSAAKACGIDVPTFELSDDGEILAIDRFDLMPDGKRLGFEDVAALMGLSVRDTLSERKYHGSYEMVADVLRSVNLGAQDLFRFFEQVAFTVMVRNGDGHLKNYGVCYDESHDATGGARMSPMLSPMFDVVTTAIYRYSRPGGGADLEDKTLALKLFRGKGQSRTYPMTDELVRFGRDICGVDRPEEVIQRIADGLSQTMASARLDPRILPELIQQMQVMWEHGMHHAVEAGRARNRGRHRGEVG